VTTLKVADFLPLYPTTDDPEFIRRLSSLHEFSSLKLTRDAGELPSASSTKKGDAESTLLTDQIFFRRLFNQSTPYASHRGFLINKEPGTGKTCSASAIIENFKISEIDETKFKPAIVLVPNDELVVKFRSEVANRCSQEYTIDGAGDLEDTILRRRIKKSISKTYEIYTHHKFLKIIEQQADQNLKLLYSNRRIIVDESHAFRYYDLPEEKDIDDADVALEDGENKTKTRKKMEEKNRMYLTLQRLIDNIVDSQIFLMTGTPMTNSVTEIASQLNLILPSSERFPTGRAFEDAYFDKNSRLKPDKANEFMTKLIGRVSFLREPYAKKSYIGDKANPWIRLSNVVLLEMSDTQAAEIDEMLTKDKRGFDQKPMSAAVATKMPTRENFKSLKDFSVKFEYLRNLLVRAKEKGECVWIACDFVSSKTSGSLTTLSAMLELLGYTQATGPELLKREGDHYIRIDQESQQLESLIKAHNRPENCYGAYNRVIIGGPKAKLGLSLSHIRHNVKMNPDWHKADENQYLARGIRYGSLNALPPEERYTNVHLLCAVRKGFIDFMRSRANKQLTKTEVDKWETIDLHVFRVSENKEEKISQIKRLLKRTAVDCAINYNRNVRKPTTYDPTGDIDGAKECEYQECNYTCFLPNNPAGLDPNVIIANMKHRKGEDVNYTILHSTKEMMLIVKQIQDIFSRTFNISFEKLKRIIRPTNDTILLLALDEIISGRVKCKNRFGFDNYLHEENNYYYLSSSFENTTYRDYFSVKYPIIISQMPINELLDGFEAYQDIKVLDDGCLSRSPKIEFEKLSFGGRIRILEGVVKEYILNPKINLKTMEMTPVLKFLVDEAKKHIAINDENFGLRTYHRLWYDEQRQFQTVKSGKERPKIEAGGLARHFLNGEWVDMTISTEKMLVVYLNKKRGIGVTDEETPQQINDSEGGEDVRRRGKKKRATVVNTAEEGGRVSTKRVGGNIKIIRPGGSVDGIQCSSINVSELHDIIKQIDNYVSYPDKNEVKYTKNELIERITDNKKLTYTQDEISKFTRDKLVSVYMYQNRVAASSGNPKKEMMCEYIEQITK
jgi:hypothetical protein